MVSTMETGLRNKVAVVTGASRGIGRATVERFAREGARVALTYAADREAAERAVGPLRDAGAEAIALPLRLEQDASIEAAFDDVLERWGGVDALVANAVRWPTARAENGRAEGLPLADWRAGLRANVEGTVATVLAALPSMRERGWGRIVFSSSGVAEEGVPGPNPYGVAKSALAGLVRQLAWDVGRDGILVNAVATGFTVTERNRDVFGDEIRAEVAARTPSGRLSGPEDVAGLIVFLASQANANLSGEVIREGSSTGRGGGRFEFL
jgi:NAD(P)-dependent dehydrogenase (short-subunit alcohol dehydrogenase family)